MREQTFHSDFRNANVLTRVSMCVLCCHLFSPHLARPFYTKKSQLKFRPFCLKSRRSVLSVSAWVLSKYFDFFFSHCSKTRKWSGDLATMLKYLQAWMWSLACLAVSPCCKLATSMLRWRTPSGFWSVGIQRLIENWWIDLLCAFTPQLDTHLAIRDNWGAHMARLIANAAVHHSLNRSRAHETFESDMSWCGVGMGK